jgi:hypothetical protein
MHRYVCTDIGGLAACLNMRARAGLDNGALFDAMLMTLREDIRRFLPRRLSD